MKYTLPLLIGLFVLLIPVISFGQFGQDKYIKEREGIATCKYNCPNQFIEKNGDLYIESCDIGNGISQRPLRDFGTKTFKFEGSVCEEMNIGRKYLIDEVMRSQIHECIKMQAKGIGDGQCENYSL